MLPWSDEKRKTYTIGATYNYIKLIADRRNPTINAIDHPRGIYRLASPLEYCGRQPVMVGFKITDGAILDSTFCELITDEEARLEELGSVQNIVQQPHAVKVEDSHISETETSA